MEVLYSKPRHVALSNDRDLYSGADNTSSNTHIKTNTRTHRHMHNASAHCNDCIERTVLGINGEGLSYMRTPWIPFVASFNASNSCGTYADPPDTFCRQGFSAAMVRILIYTPLTPFVGATL